MSSRLAFTLTCLLLATCANLAFPQEQNTPTSDNNFWVNYWSQPKVILFGQEEQDFYKSMQAVAFPWNDFNNPLNASALESNAQWLKDHPDVRFYVSGYASAEGTIVYNLGLSQQRADWVKQALVSRGVPENRIEMAVGWGQLYPVCADFSDECLSKNRLVRFRYAPAGSAPLVGQARIP